MLARSGAILLVLLGLLPMAGADAQGLLQSGLGAPSSRSLPPPALYRLPPNAGPGTFRDLFEDEAPRAEPTYRSVCVRLCDGYYFPVSFATTQYGLDADAERCSASCSSEARLFFQASPGGDIGAAADFMGLRYESLPNAFKYRKTLVEGCQCKPQPWASEERQRHQSYAALRRKPELPAQAVRAPELSGERPLALLRRAAPEAPSPAKQADLELPMPTADDAPAPRRRPMLSPADYGFFFGARTILYGLPPALPRRR